MRPPQHRYYVLLVDAEYRPYSSQSGPFGSKWEQPAATHAATANIRHLNVFYGKAARLSARIVPEPLMTRYGKGRAA